jgi:hypothetical protein
MTKETRKENPHPVVFVGTTDSGREAYTTVPVSYLYTLIPFCMAVIGFFMLPLPWYLALPAAFGIYFVGMVPLMIKFMREDR